MQVNTPNKQTSNEPNDVIVARLTLFIVCWILLSIKTFNGEIITYVSISTAIIGILGNKPISNNNIPVINGNR